MNDWVQTQADIVRVLHVRIGRQTRKIEKLQRARDFHKGQAEQYKKVLNHVPHVKRSYDSYTEMIKERARVKDLERRVNEQEMLIRYLSGGKIQSWEIEKFYGEWIKQTHTELKAK